jgi:hypothetical protein
MAIERTAGERHRSDDAHLLVFDHGVHIASVKKHLTHQVMSMKARGNDVETVVNGDPHRTNCRAGRSTLLRSIIECRRAQVQPLFHR